MRTISAEQRQALEDLSAEGLLGNLPIQTAEKDIHITDLLRALSTHQVKHDYFADMKKGEVLRHDQGIKLVFAGGTCLSKAHSIINRMSEDIDIKVVLEPVTLKKRRANRSRLVALHDGLPPLLESIGLPLLPYLDGDSNPTVGSAHRYYVAGAGYESTYDELPSLRPELKLELVERTPLLPVESRTFGYLYESLAKLEPSSPVTIVCISVAETAAEKVLSLLRRCAFKWSGVQRGEMDPALVRHVYDVSRILQMHPDAMPAAKSVFGELVEGDRRSYGRQAPNFNARPLDVLKDTLRAARTSEELAARYQERVIPLVFDDAPPSYAQAFTSFEALAAELLGAR